MTVGELKSRLTEPEYLDAIAFMNWEAEQADRIRKGLPLDNGRQDDAESLNRTMNRFVKNIKARGGNA